MIYTFIFTSHVELGFDVKIIHWTIIHSQPKRCWKLDILETVVILISDTNMKAPFSLLALFTRREGNPGVVERVV